LSKDGVEASLCKAWSNDAGGKLQNTQRDDLESTLQVQKLLGGYWREVSLNINSGTLINDNIDSTFLVARIHFCKSTSKPESPSLLHPRVIARIRLARFEKPWSSLPYTYSAIARKSLVMPGRVSVASHL